MTHHPKDGCYRLQTPGAETRPGRSLEKAEPKGKRNNIRSSWALVLEIMLKTDFLRLKNKKSMMKIV